MPTSRRYSAASSSKQIMGRLCKLARQRSQIRTQAKRLLKQINQIERPDSEKIAHQLTSPNIRHYLEHNILNDGLSYMMGHMLGGLGAIMAYDAVKEGAQTVPELGVAWLVGSAFGMWANKKMMELSSMSLNKNTDDLCMMKDKHDQLKREMVRVKSGL